MSGSRPSNREEAHFVRPKETFRKGGKGIRRERDGDPLRGSPKLGTCATAVDARKRIPGTGDKLTKSNRTVVVVLQGEPTRDPRSGARHKSHRSRVEGELKVSGGLSEGEWEVSGV